MSDDLVKRLRCGIRDPQTLEEAADEIEKLRQQRDELLLALEEILFGHKTPEEAFEQARNAIAKCKEE